MIFFEQICSFLRICSNLLKKILSGKLIFWCNDVFPKSIRKRKNNDQIDAFNRCVLCSISIVSTFMLGKSQRVFQGIV